jgi:hypothetical protein
MTNQERTLKRIIREEKAKIAEYITGNDLDSAESSFRRIDLAGKSLADKERFRNKLISSGIIIVVICIISLLYHIRIPTANISVNTISTGFSAHVKQSWHSGNILECKGVRINRVNRLTVLPAFQQFSNRTNVGLNGNKIVLKEMAIPEGTWIDIDMYRENGLIMLIRNGYVVCEFVLDKGYFSIDTAIWSVEGNVIGLPQTFHLNSDTATPLSEPIMISFLNISAFNLSLPVVDTLYFAKPGESNPGAFVPSLISGEIKFQETVNTYTLTDFDKLLIISDSITRFKNNLGKTGLESDFVGGVKHVTSKIGRQSLKIKPTLLEYLYNNQPLAIFWSSIVFLAGIVWSIKKSLF